MRYSQQKFPATKSIFFSLGEKNDRKSFVLCFFIMLLSVYTDKFFFQNSEFIATHCDEMKISS